MNVCINYVLNVLDNKKMLEHDRIDMSKGTDVNKSDSSRECIICLYS